MTTKLLVEEQKRKEKKTARFSFVYVNIFIVDSFLRIIFIISKNIFSLLKSFLIDNCLTYSKCAALWKISYLSVFLTIIFIYLLMIYCQRNEKAFFRGICIADTLPTSDTYTKSHARNKFRIFLHNTIEN
jgi:hypothetical protein